MVHASAVVSTAAALLLALPFGAQAQAMYSKNSPVVQITGRTYDKLIAQSNYTSMVEFYAPWCGHCKNLKPAYEKAAKNLQGLAHVAAINCDDEANKPFCGKMGVQGFPTLKLIKPGKKPGRPFVEDYNGARSTKAIVTAVLDKMPNHVNRLTDENLPEWLITGEPAAKALLFSDKGATSPLIKAIAIEFLGKIGVAQVRDSQRAAVDTFKITSFPTLVLLPGTDAVPVVYAGPMKKEDIVAFLSSVAPPNAEAAEGKKAVKDKKKTAKAHKTPKEDAAPPKASEDQHVFEEPSSSDDLASTSTPAENPSATPQQDRPTTHHNLSTLSTPSLLLTTCLTPTSPPCGLALLPLPSPSQSSESSLSNQTLLLLLSLSSLQSHYQARGKNFPLYAVPATNPLAAPLRQVLGLRGEEEEEFLVVNVKRGWWGRYAGAWGAGLGEWVDGVRAGEGRESLPDGFGEVVKGWGEDVEEGGSEGEGEEREEREGEDGHDEL